MLLLVAAACGGKEEIPVDASMKSAAVTSAKALAGAPTGSNLSADEAMQPLASAFGSAQVVASADSASSSTDLGAPAPGYSSSSGCVQATPGKVTFANCSSDSGSLNGSISYGGGSFTANLTAKVDFGGIQFTIAERAELHVSAAHVSGSAHADIALTDTKDGISATATQDVSVDIGYTNGCPTSGSLSVDAHASSSGRSASVSVEADFGPACGDVRFFR